VVGIRKWEKRKKNTEKVKKEVCWTERGGSESEWKEKEMRKNPKLGRKGKKILIAAQVNPPDIQGSRGKAQRKRGTLRVQKKTIDACAATILSR